MAERRIARSAISIYPITDGGFRTGQTASCEAAEEYGILEKIGDFLLKNGCRVERAPAEESASPFFRSLRISELLEKIGDFLLKNGCRVERAPAEESASPFFRSPRISELLEKIGDFLC